MTSMVSIAIPPVLLISAMFILSRINGKQIIVRELKRKALHICIGVTAISFPLFLNETWMIVAAVGLVVAWLMAVRQVPAFRQHFGSVLHDIRRKSLGEIYFALSIGGLLLLTQNEPVLFVIPILILALADAVAAIVGKILPIVPLAGIARGKTAAGCTAFFVVAFIVSFWSLVAIADLQMFHALAIATSLAMATCLTEAISRRGIDNLLVPAAAYLILLGSNIPDFAGRTTIARLQLELDALVTGLWS
jgi:phytol kinase